MTATTERNRMNLGTAGRSVMLALSFASAACDGLRPSPGHDFGVKLLHPPQIAAIGKITVPLRVAVTGCSAFDAAVAAAGTSHAVALAGQPDDSFLATVPVEWLRPQDLSCTRDADAPAYAPAQLVVSCRDAGRQATVELEVEYGTATRAYQYFSDGAVGSRAFVFPFPNTDPLQPWVLALPPFGSGAYLGPLVVGPGGVAEAEFGDFMQPLARPRLISRSLTGGSIDVFQSSACASCGAVDIAPGLSVASAVVWRRGVGAIVAENVLDLAFAEDGAVLVLSQPDLPDLPPSRTAAVLSRIVPSIDPTAGGTVEVVSVLRGEQAMTRFSRTASGALAFVTFVVPQAPGPVTAALHTTDGSAVTTEPVLTGTSDIGELRADGTYLIGSADLAPDATSVLLNGRLLGAAGDRWEELSLPWGSRLGPGGVAWLRDAVAGWFGDSFWSSPLLGAGTQGPGFVRVVDRAPPHVLRYHYQVDALPGSNSPARLYGASAVGDKLVLTTSTGVRILGPDGTVIGGSDPLPCGLAPTAIAEQIGPTTAGVAAGAYVYVFDIPE